MFLPSEAVYAELHANFTGLVEESYRARVWIVSPTTMMATLNTVRAVLKDVRMREQAGEIQKTVGLLLEDVRRLDDRVDKLKAHFAQTEKDLRDLDTSADRITKRGQRILDVDLGEEPRRCRRRRPNRCRSRRMRKGGSDMSASIATLKALCQAFNDHDLDRIMSFFADDAVLEMPRDRTPGADAMSAPRPCGTGCARFEGLPDVHYGEDSHYVDGDMGISQWTVTGTMKSGERIRARGCDFYTFRGDKVVKKNWFWKIVEKA